MPVPEGTTPETITEAGKESLVGFVSDVVSGTFQDSVYMATDYPGFLAEGAPIGVPAKVSQGVGRAACRTYARGGGPQNLPGFDGVWSGICGPYLESIGEAPSAGSLAPPFTGGQCTGVEYRAAREVFNPTSQTWGTVNTVFDIYGPVSSIRVEAVTSTTSRWVVVHRNQANTQTVTRTFNQNTAVDRIRWGPLARNNGAADTCGNPPPIYAPPKIKPGLPSLPATPIDIPGVGPVNINVEFNPDGTINVKLPDIGIEAPIEVPFNVDIGGGGGDGGGSGPSGPAPGDDGTPATGQVAAPGEDAEGEAPPGSILVGLRMNMTTIPENPNQYIPGAYRGAAYIYMGGNGGLDQDFAGSILANGQFVYAEKDNLTRWKVRANNGFVFNVVPYYREVES